VDNNKQPQSPQPTPSVIQPPVEKEGTNMVMWFIIGLVVVGIVVFGIYGYLGKQQTSSQSAPQGSNQPATTSENFDKDLNSIDVQASDSSDFTSVDQDIKDL